MQAIILIYSNLKIQYTKCYVFKEFLYMGSRKHVTEVFISILIVTHFRFYGIF